MIRSHAAIVARIVERERLHILSKKNPAFSGRDAIMTEGMLIEPTRVSMLASLLFLLMGAPVYAGNANDYTYLALGDSVAFGMNVLLLPPFAPPYPLPTPDQFIGYPESLAAAEHLLQSKKEVNAACPGETSGSFLNIAALDFGCNSPHPQPSGPPLPPFKTTIGLHTMYMGAQIDFAESQLMSNKHINLVTLSIGANDVLLILPALLQCGDNKCVQDLLAPVLNSYAANLAVILTRLRAQYSGRLILLTYYSPSPLLDGLTMELNNVMIQVAGLLAQQPGFIPVIFADGFSAFQLASANFNHDACQAGLLIPLPAGSPTPCDIHPSALGRDVLADAVEMAMQGKK